MLSSLGNKTKRIILLALSALLLCALPAFAAEKIELWNGDIRKGSVSVRMNGTLREMAVDEVVSALGFAPKNDGTSLVVTMGGKKIEFWNGSNIVRAAGTIISFPTPVVTKDGHWWGEGRSLLSAFDSFYKAIGQKAAFRWGDTKTVAAAQPAPKKQPAPKIQPKQSAPVKKPAQPAKPKPKAETPKAEPKQEAQAPAKAAAPTGGPSTAGVRPELAELRGTTKKANRIRKVTARITRESLQSSAQLTQVFEVDMTRVAQLRGEVKEQFADKHGVKLTYLPFYAKAVIEALVSHPNVNASYNEESNEITYHGSVNLGIAVDTEAGLLSPVIKDAQDMDIPALSKAIIDLAERARASKLTPDDLSGGTFTITNIGSEGALFDTPILVPPQAAMLGTGAIVRRPVVDSDADGESIAIRSMGYTPLTYDHRLIDGADAGRFLTTVKDRLEKAEFEGDLGL